MLHTPVVIKGFDSVTWGDIPSDAAVVFYYDDGRYVEQVTQLRAHCPHAILIPIAVRANYAAKAKIMFLDDEPGDATNDQLTGWYHLAKEVGVEKPGDYTSISNAKAVIDIMDAHGFEYGTDWLLWTAHYTGIPHICGPQCGFGMDRYAHNTQYTDRALNVNLDGDLCTDEGVGIVPAPTDPNHYDWYPTDARKFLNGRSERWLAETYDEHRVKILPGESLRELSHQCGQAAARIEHLIKTELVKGKEEPNLFNRRWRATMLDKRASRQKVAI